MAQDGSKLAHVGPSWGDFKAMLAYVGASWGFKNTVKHNVF
jgi:hypothetical protein